MTTCSSSRNRSTRPHRRTSAVSPSSKTATASDAARSDFLPPRPSPSDDDPSRLRVAVLTGWLGAGKTTTLTRWLEAAAAERDEAKAKGGKPPPRVRLIINDVGAASVDAGVLSRAAVAGSDAASSPPVSSSLVALTAGCACCSMQAELVDAVADAAADAREFASSSSSSAAIPDSWLFIECTGLALPAPVASAVVEGVRRARREGGGGDEGDDDDEEESALEAVVAVVDASTFAAGLAGAFDVDEDEEDDDFEDGEGSESREEVDFADDEAFEELAGVASAEGSVADLLASQVEAADVVLLNKCDAVSLEALEEARDLVEALNPGARVVEGVKGDVPPSSLLGEAASVDEGGSGARRRRRGVAGWAAALASAAEARKEGGEQEEEEEGDDGHHSHHHEHEHGHGHGHSHSHEETEKTSQHHQRGISSFVFHSGRPFHPSRLLSALEDDGGDGGGGVGPWEGVVRSKGFFWLATRPRVAGLWQGAGGSWVGDPSHLWENEDSSPSPSRPPAQELVFIGNRAMSEARVRRALEGALLTDEEMRGGEGAWASLDDPLPPWEL